MESVDKNAFKTRFYKQVFFKTGLKIGEKNSGFLIKKVLYWRRVLFPRTLVRLNPHLGIYVSTSECGNRSDDWKGVSSCLGSRGVGGVGWDEWSGGVKIRRGVSLGAAQIPWVWEGVYLF